MAVGAGVGVDVDVDVGTDVEVGSGVRVGSGVAGKTTSFIKTSGVDSGFSSASEQAANKTRITDIPNSRLSIIKHYTQTSR